MSSFGCSIGNDFRVLSKMGFSKGLGVYEVIGRVGSVEVVVYC